MTVIGLLEGAITPPSWANRASALNVPKTLPTVVAPVSPFVTIAKPVAPTLLPPSSPFAVNKNPFTVPVTLRPAITPSIKVGIPQQTPFVLAPRSAPDVVTSFPTMQISAPPAFKTPAASPWNRGSAVSAQCALAPWLPACKPGLNPGSGAFIPSNSVPGGTITPPSIVTPGYNIPGGAPSPGINPTPPTMTIDPGPSSPAPVTPDAPAASSTGGAKWMLPIGAAVLAYFFLEG
jgi:hypothetical protein